MLSFVINFVILGLTFARFEIWEVGRVSPTKLIQSCSFFFLPSV